MRFRYHVRRGQAEVIATTILIAGAIVIGLAMWSLYTQTIASQKQGVDIYRVLAEEDTYTGITRFIGPQIVDEGSTVIVYQISRYSLEPLALYIAAIARTDNGFSIPSCRVYRASQSSLIELDGSEWIELKKIHEATENVILWKPNKEHPLSIAVGKTSIPIYVATLRGGPTLIKIELKTTAKVVTILFGTRIGNKIYMFHSETLFLG